MKLEITNPEEVLKLAAKIYGSRGGRSKSPKKMAALAQNRKKAWAARRKKAA